MYVYGRNKVSYAMSRIRRCIKGLKQTRGRSKPGNNGKQQTIASSLVPQANNFAPACNIPVV